MTTPNSIERPDASLTREWSRVARFYLGSRRGVLSLAVLAVLAGLAFNWNWLVATGVAPILIAVLPCAVMCGLGLCFHKLFGASHSTEPPRQSIAADQTAELPTRPNPAALINSRTDCCGHSTDEAAQVQMKSPLDDERRDSNA